MIFDNWNRQDALEEVASRRHKPAIEEEHAPEFKKFQGAEFLKQARKSMRKMGIPLGPCAGLMTTRPSRREADERPALGSNSQESKELNHG